MDNISRELNNESLIIEMIPGGGFVAVFTPTTEAVSQAQGLGE
jgi:hypothetical protein